MENHSNQTPPTLAFDRGTLVVSGALEPLAEPFTWDARTRQWRCHARHYVAVRRALHGRVQDTLPPPRAIRWPHLGLPTLRPDQQQALAAWEAAGRVGQIIMPTGTGKTVVALAAMARCAVASLVVAPIRDLMYQWHRRIARDLGFNAGILGDGRHEIWPVTVTTYDSAYIHMERMGAQFGLVIFDEEH
ncbi:MAG: DEAD/DEAH box helicase family protein, partial [Planctomycetota bacterium]